MYNPMGGGMYNPGMRPGTLGGANLPQYNGPMTGGGMGGGLPSDTQAVMRDYPNMFPPQGGNPYQPANPYQPPPQGGTRPNFGGGYGNFGGGYGGGPPHEPMPYFGGGAQPQPFTGQGMGWRHGFGPHPYQGPNGQSLFQPPTGVAPPGGILQYRGGMPPQGGGFQQWNGQGTPPMAQGGGGGATMYNGQMYYY